jgi:putative salt-induced outer membrane protein
MKTLLFLGALSSFVFLSTQSFAADDRKEGLSNESSAGIVVTSGNSETSTLNLNQKNAWLVAKNIYKFEGLYLHTSNQGIEQSLQWSLGLRFERELSDQFNIFIAETENSDRYQGINQRYNTDLGGKYYFEKNEALNWFSEAGYRFTRENYPYGFKNLNFIRLYNEMERTFHKGLSAKWWFEYLPNLTQWKGYQFNSELSLAMSLTDIFALKSAYQIRYNNEPPTGVAKTTDTTFTTSLVAKF